MGHPNRLNEGQSQGTKQLLPQVLGVLRLPDGHLLGVVAMREQHSLTEVGVVLCSSPPLQDEDTCFRTI